MWTRKLVSLSKVVCDSIQHLIQNTQIKRVNWKIPRSMRYFWVWNQWNDTKSQFTLCESDVLVLLQQSVLVIWCSRRLCTNAASDSWAALLMCEANQPADSLPGNRLTSLAWKQMHSQPGTGFRRRRGNISFQLPLLPFFMTMSRWSCQEADENKCTNRARSCSAFQVVLCHQQNVGDRERERKYDEGNKLLFIWCLTQLLIVNLCRKNQNNASGLCLEAKRIGFTSLIWSVESCTANLLPSTATSNELHDLIVHVKVHVHGREVLYEHRKSHPTWALNSLQAARVWTSEVFIIIAPTTRLFCCRENPSSRTRRFPWITLA